MRRGKKPTREQRKMIEKNGLSANDWYVSKDTPNVMELVNRADERIVKTIQK